MPLAVNQVFAGYTILRPLGAGAMGEVYLAQHPRLPRNDALKVLAATVSADDEYRKRFNLEADIAATLWHPNIVSIHDRGEFDGQLWIAMDYVEGVDAADVLLHRHRYGMPPDEVVRIITAVADALDYAHKRNLLHRDVKPSNILLADTDSDNPRILLADFGIARWIDRSTGLTGSNMTVGTVAYAAPEQLKGEAIDGRADQYALAATAFHLLTGSQPFQHSNPAVVISQHLTSDPPAIGSRRPELSELGPVLSKALAKSPEGRYERCIDFARALERRIGTAAAEAGANDVTEPALVASGPRHAKNGRNGSSSRRGSVVPVLIALLVMVAGTLAYVLFHDEHAYRSAAKNPTLPVVYVGADCTTVGAAGISDTGQPAYCAHLPATNHKIWSVYPGEVARPTGTAAPTETTYAAPTELPVLVCMEQTHQTRLQCHEDVTRGNNGGPPLPTG
jgi:serine/threonine-protein kinase